MDPPPIHPVAKRRRSMPCFSRSWAQHWELNSENFDGFSCPTGEAIKIGGFSQSDSWLNMTQIGWGKTQNWCKTNILGMHSDLEEFQTSIITAVLRGQALQGQQDLSGFLRYPNDQALIMEILRYYMDICRCRYCLDSYGYNDIGVYIYIHILGI